MNVHFQSRAQKPPLESSQCSLWASECGAEEAIWLYYFTYSFTATRGVLVSCGALAISSNENSRSGQSSSFAGLLPWAVLKPCLSAPTGCRAREVQKRLGGNQLRLEQADRAAARGDRPKGCKMKRGRLAAARLPCLLHVSILRRPEPGWNSGCYWIQRLLRHTGWKENAT